MNALRSFASQVLSTVGQKEASGARERDSGQAETSGRLSDRLPEVVFDESCSAELKLLQIWNKYYSARREKKAEVSVAWRFSCTRLLSRPKRRGGPPKCCCSDENMLFCIIFRDCFTA